MIDSARISSVGPRWFESIRRRSLNGKHARFNHSGTTESFSIKIRKYSEFPTNRKLDRIRELVIVVSRTPCCYLEF